MRNFKNFKNSKTSTKSFTLISLFFVVGLFSTSCSTYLWHVQTNYLKILQNKVPIEEALEKYDLSEDEKEKLKMVDEIKTYAIENLKLDIDKNIYSEYVQLDRPYVTYLLRVSHYDELKPHTWNMPIVGTVPYLGFFSLERAQQEEKEFSKTEYDTYVRGVSAFSTLKWFEDPILSSMLSYETSDFVNTIFHELAHSLLFFNDHIDFNERFAEFVGRKASLQFYLSKEGDTSLTVQKMQNSWHDELIFSRFISQELELLQEWYLSHKGRLTPELKRQRIQQIQVEFETNLKSQLKTDRYYYFSQREFNNAQLLPYRSYSYKMDEFEVLYEHSQNLHQFIEELKPLRESENPETALSEKIKTLR